MNVLLLQLDGKIPNIALMRLSSHHKELGNNVEFRWAKSIDHVAPGLFERPDAVYASLIFDKTKRHAESLLREFPSAVVGGTGWDVSLSLESIGVTTKNQDYSLYPKWSQSIGFTQRGCRLKCPFCVVPTKEGRVAEEQSIAEIWRGEPYPKHLLLLDNDFFGQPRWRERIAEIRGGGFRVSFNQGINVRFIKDDSAAAIASVNYYDDGMRTRRIYTAWDSTKDEGLIRGGIGRLVDAGVKPDHIMVYMLINYWPGETTDDWEYRRGVLRELGCRPYPMPYKRTTEAVGFQRFVIGAYDKRVRWSDFTVARYDPRRLRVCGLGEG